MPEELSSGIFRYALGIEYNGQAYHGWQRQKGHPEPSVQAFVETGISAVANEPVSVVCAGRTDTGVHASEQVIHFDTRAVREDKAWVLGVNTHLPDDIAVLWVRRVDEDFHARFSAQARTYRYFILNRPTRPALAGRLMTWVKQPLDEVKMREASHCLLGEQDFTSFRGASCQSKTPFRFVEAIEVKRQESVVIVEITANAFLHHMVRNIVGSLIEVGKGAQPVDWISELLQVKDRCQAGKTAPSNGLFLWKVRYPSGSGLPEAHFAEEGAVSRFVSTVTGSSGI